MATDGQVDTNDNVRGNPPPWMKGKAKPNQPNPQMDARKKVAAERLAKMKGGKK